MNRIEIICSTCGGHQGHVFNDGPTDSGKRYCVNSISVDFRSNNLESLENLEKNSIDFYASVKSLYLQNRAQKISNAPIADKDQDDSDWEEIDNQ